MELSSLYVDQQVFLFICIPLFFFNFTGNSFYAYCLVFSKLKQPLKLLLGSLVCCAIVFLAHLSFISYQLPQTVNLDMFTVSWMVMRFAVHSTVTCFVWLSFYYYIQIVPSQTARLMWVKRNISPFIYTALLLEEIFLVLHGALDAASEIIQFSNWNGSQTEHSWNGLYTTSQVTFFIDKLHILGCLSIMTVSNFSTVHYLYRHMKSVAWNSFSTPKIQSQMRVTIAGGFQIVLSLFYGVFFLIDSISYKFSPYYSFGPWLSLTLSFLYMSGTTVNLAIGQTIFRQRAANVWKALRALCKVSNDVKMQTSQ